LQTKIIQEIRDDREFRFISFSNTGFNRTFRSLLIRSCFRTFLCFGSSKKTLDVLLTTNLNPWRIITGKLEASLGVVLILTVSALPVLSLVVVFGGTGLGGLLLMAGGLLLTGIFVGSIGIFCSVVFKRTTLATVLSYVIVVFLVVGICACTGLAYYAGLLQQEMTAAYQQIDVGGAIYLLLFNPFTSFAGIISRQLGNGREMEQLCYLLGNYGQNPLIHYLPRLHIGMVVEYG